LGAASDPWVQPAILEDILLQREAGILPYYEVAQCAPHKKDVSVFKVDIYEPAVTDLNALVRSEPSAQVQREPAPPWIS